MSKEGHTDFVADYCRGKKPEFANTVCKHYDVNAQECSLMRNNMVELLFKEGQCKPSEMIFKACKTRIKKNFFKSLDEHEKRYIDGECRTISFFIGNIIKKGLQKKPLETFILPVLSDYIGTTVSHEVPEALRRLGKLPKPKECGNCLGFSRGKPSRCSIKGLPEIEGENPEFGNKRNASDTATACSWYKRFNLESSIPHDDIERDAVKTLSSMNTVNPAAKSRVDSINEALKDRINSAKGRNLKVCQREFDIFARGLILFSDELDSNSDDLDPEKVFKSIAQELNISSKTVQRDFEKIKDYLKKRGIKWP